MVNRSDQKGSRTVLLGFMDGKEIPHSRHEQERLVMSSLPADAPRAQSSTSWSSTTHGRNGKTLVGKVGC